MKLVILALLPITLAAASPSQYGSQPSLGSKHDAAEIVQKYVSVLQQKEYNGKKPSETAEEIIAPNYQDFSDSVHSTLKQELNGQPLSRDRTQFLENVATNSKKSPPPFAQLESTNVLCAEDNVIFWSWRLAAVGSGKYPVKGTQLFYLDDHGQIYKSEFEFNSLAWGADTGQVNAYCG
ncbi:hypothetical protein Tdes44962_MAKER06218 [Teratosphaeria destructans]|uniref:NTF2-like domain-containing protein n=1 Tax=Teratosphaeria destructans TaxID=418781 RepID=A0A9W7VY29_9PEZI|nr:hypothetical protein Tdes44962_MAKER06218 [Teratosphaeria destructans]